LLCRLFEDFNSGAGLLVELSIANIAIIESQRLTFGPGFTVLTGETGAGKSIIVDAMSLLLGERASTELIRTGCDIACVEGIFALDPPIRKALQPFLQGHGLTSDEDVLILRREIRRNGRNICRVNGQAVTLATLQEISSHLVDIHGQGEHLSLMQAQRQIDFLDHYGKLVEERARFAERASELAHVRRELKSLRRDERELARRADLLAYQIAEIRGANLEPNEEQELKEQRDLLSSAEARMELANRIYSLLVEGEVEGYAAVLDVLGEALAASETLVGLDAQLTTQHKTLEDALYQLEDLAREIRNYRDAIEFDPRALEEVEDRLALIHSLKRKYGDSIPEILAFADRAQRELETLTHSEERIKELETRETALLEELGELGCALSQARRRAAQALQQAIERELMDLGMENARFLVHIEWQEAADGIPVKGRRYRFTTTGLDRVAFLIAPNPGEEPKSLARIASGGETSRLMLAMKTALSQVDPVPTLIFDEIDSGIGGRTGTIVGQKLRSLAQDHQVFCVTHLPQIARYAQAHYRISKTVVEGRTISEASLLSPEERIEELAVMLSGAATESTRRSAREMLRQASS